MRSRTRHPVGEYMPDRIKGQEPNVESLGTTLNAERAGLLWANIGANSITPDSGMSRSKSKRMGTRKDRMIPARRAEYTRSGPLSSAGKRKRPIPDRERAERVRPTESEAMAALGPGTRPAGRAASGRQDLNLRPPDPEPGALPD